MTTQASKQAIYINTAIAKAKGDELQTLLKSINEQPSLTDMQTMNLITKYFTDSQQALESTLEHYTQSKLSLIESTSHEINRLRYLIQELNNHVTDRSHLESLELNSNDRTAPHSPKSRTQSLTVSPINLPSPEIEIKPLDLSHPPQKLKQRRYSTIPDSWSGQYRIETIKEGNNTDYPYPNDKVTIQYSMFAINKSYNI